MKPDPTICPDCGRNSEFILHEEGCPQFGREVQEFIEKHDAEIASWPEEARKSLDRLNAMQACLFGKTLKLRRLLQKLYDTLPHPLAWINEDMDVVREVEKELNRPTPKPAR